MRKTQVVNHTPTPWRVEKNDWETETRVRGITSVVAICEEERNAAFIVKAANAYDPLKKAFRLLHRDKWLGRPKEEHDALCAICPELEGK